MRRSRRQRFRMKQRDEDIREPPNGDSPAKKIPVERKGVGDWADEARPRRRIEIVSR